MPFNPENHPIPQGAERNRIIPCRSTFLFIWMRVDSWDPLVYYIEKVYHTPQDTVAENISPERMQTALEVIGSAVFDLARKPVPAWEYWQQAG